MPANEISKAVVAVLLPREHLPFIREWCIHHLDMGWTIFLYDNTGSQGSTRKTSSFVSGSRQSSRTDKRGNLYGNFSKHLSDEQLDAAFRNEIKDLDVTVVRWQPRDGTGRIVHGQVEAYVDFIQRYRKTVSWAAFLDADEYLYATPGTTWDQILGSLEDHECHRLMLEGVEYESRWSADGRPLPRSELGFCGKQRGGQKNIVRTNMTILADIHWGWRMRENNGYATADTLQLHFRHYKGRKKEPMFQFQSPPGHEYECESLPINAELLSENLGSSSPCDPVIQFSNWSISSDLSHYLSNNLKEIVPQASSILELGPGQSTKILAKSFPETEILSIEHDTEWLQRAQNFLGSLPNVRLQLAPLHPNGKWYNLDKSILGLYDILMVDGPPGFISPRIREEALSLIDHLSMKALVILNNTNRPDEKSSINQWLIKGFQIITQKETFCVLQRI